MRFGPRMAIGAALLVVLIVIAGLGWLVWWAVGQWVLLVIPAVVLIYGLGFAGEKIDGMIVRRAGSREKKP